MFGIENPYLSTIVNVVTVLGGLTTALGAMLYVNQNKLLYMPNPPGIPKTPDENPVGWKTPREWNSHGHQKMHKSDSEDVIVEDTMIETFDGVKIHTWLIMHRNAERFPTLIYFHGNAGNMGFRLKNAMMMFAACDLNIMMVDYRGYGKSEGVPSEEGLNFDGDAAVQFVANHPRLRKTPIICFGRSLGGAVSIALAKRWPEVVKAVVVENTFLSVAAMVDKLMPFAKNIKHLILRIGWNSDNVIPTLKQPIMFISGDSDELVPTQHMVQLHRLASNSTYKDFFSVRGGTHNDTWERAGSTYYQRLKGFVHQCFPEVSSASRSDLPVGDRDEVEIDGSGTYIPTMRTNFKVN